MQKDQKANNIFADLGCICLLTSDFWYVYLYFFHKPVRRLGESDTRM